MIGFMIRWLRVSLPPLGWIAGFAVFYGAMFGFFHWLESRVGGPLLDDQGRPLPPMIYGSILVFGALAFASWRALAFHPVSSHAYRQWLAATPWTGKKPLPLGPVHLVPQDVLLIGTAVLFAWLSGDAWSLFVPQAFMVIYLLLVGYTLFATGTWPWGYAVLFGVGLTVRLWHFIPASLGAALGAYLVAYLGLRHSFTLFPWDKTWIAELDMALGKSKRTESGAVGWPYSRLAPKYPGSETRFPLHHALMLSGLIGWWLYVVASLFPRPASREDFLLLILGAVMILAPLFRLFTYANGYLPPISVLGRLAKFRWIIPGYDQIVVAPLLAFMAGSTLEVAGTLLGVDPLIGRPVAIAVILAMCLGLGPSLKTWRLTGNHRIAITTLRAETVRVG